VADYNVGQAYLTVLPSLAGFGDDVRRQLAEQDLTATVDVKPEVDTAELDSEIARVKAELDELSGKDVEIGADDADAVAKIDELKAKLAELEGQRAEVRATADAAEAKAELDDVKLKMDELDGKTATVRVKADTSQAKEDVNALGLAIAGLGSALVPIGAAAVGGLGGLAGAAVFAAGAMGVVKLATGGVGTAVSQLEQAQTSQGQNAAQMAAQEISSANSVANAQDSLAQAVANVGVVQETANRAVAQAEEQRAAAAEALDVAEQTAARNVASALEQQQQAEQSLENAIRSQTQAQQALTQARIDAQNALINSTLSVQDNALAQRSAQLQLEQAQANLAQLSPTATALQRQQAQLAVDQAQQQIIDTKAMGDQLAQRNQQLQAQGVEGSQQVVSAQNAIVTANQQVANSQQRVTDATNAVTQARLDGDRAVSDAERRLSDSTNAVTVAEENGARQVAAAKQSVVTATRALESAEASQAAQQAAANTQTNAAAKALASLTPAQQQFAQFLVSLKPQIDAVKQAAAGGLLPGVEDGIKALEPVLPLITQLVSTFSTSLGDLARDAGQALNSPTWTGFISFLNGEAGPSIHTFGVIIGNLATGAIGLIQAFKPVWDEMGAGLEHLTGDFANFGQNAGTNSAFQQFLSYIQQEGPVVVQTLEDLAGAAGHIFVALEPIGDVVLIIVDDLAQLVSAIPTPLLSTFIGVLLGGYVALQSWKIIKNVTTDIKDFYTAIVGLPEKIGNIAGKFSDWIAKWAAMPDLEMSAVTSLEEHTAATEANTVSTDSNTVSNDERNVATEVGAIDLDALTASELGTTVAVEGETVAEEGATVAQEGLNLAMDANPIGLVITVLAALVLVVIEVWQHFDTLKSIVGDVWNFLGSVISGTYNNVIKPVLDFFGGIISGLAGLFQTAVNNIGTIWNGLGNVVKAPVNFVIDPIYDKGIAGLWNDIAGVFGLPQLPIIPTLAAGGVLPGYLPGQDTVPAMLSPGEGVLVPEAVSALGPDFVYWANSTFSNRPGVSAPGHYASGGIVADLAGMFTDPAGTITRLFSGTTGQTSQIPGSGELHQALVAIPGKVVDAVIAKAKDLVASAASAVTGAIGGGVEQWRTTGVAALAAEGRPATEIGPLLAQMTTESGGNPTVVNTWDSNWAAGTPSVGLMQVIGPTYSTYKDARFDKGPYEYGVSVDPMANITSAIRYTVAAYGNPASIWGQGHGYDSGGWLPPGTTLAHNGTRAPEAVLTSSQWQAVKQMATSRQPVTVNVYPRANHSEVEIADQVSRQLALALRSNL
jgi:SLT domain-containing protein